MQRDVFRKIIIFNQSQSQSQRKISTNADSINYKIYKYYYYYYYDYKLNIIIIMTALSCHSCAALFSALKPQSTSQKKNNLIEIDIKMEIELLIIQFLDLIVCRVFILFIYEQWFI